MNCERIRPLLPRLAAADLPAASARRVREHLADCPACSAELAALERVPQLLQAAPAAPPPSDLWARVDAELDAPRRRRLPRLVWAGAGLAAALLVAVSLWPRDGHEDTPYLRDHYRVAATAPFGNPAMGDVMSALAAETP